MTDDEIIDLYFARAETAITETDKKYGSYCRSITFNILGSKEDSEECVNDTYLKLWNVIPPKRPARFAVFIAATARNISLNLRRGINAAKRGGRSFSDAYDEISELVPAKESVESLMDEKELIRLLNGFISGLGNEKQLIFMKRYWHFMPIADIAGELNVSEEKVRTTLFRTREKLKKYLRKEGIDV